MFNRREFFGALTAASAASAAPPNFLLITADNLGYGDLGCYGNREIRSPHLDRFASQGVRFTNFYTASPTCTASRAGLLTGRHPLRYGLNYQLNAAENKGGIGLPHSEKLISGYLKDAGYATGCFGKWNLGFAPGSRPTERGFDEFFGHRSGNIDYYTHFYNGELDMYRGVEPARVDGYSPDLFADAACGFMTRQAARPFFVYLPFNTPHFPNKANLRGGESLEWQVPSRYLEQYGYAASERDEKKRYRAVVTAMDDAFGRVLRKLDELGLADRTVVMFHSDNGAFMLPGRGLEVQTNRPLRDGGVTCWEGGIRVAGMVRWPGVTRPGRLCDEMLSAMDLLPLMTGAAGVALPRDRVFDGRDPRRVLRGAAPSPHEALYFEFQKHQAMRWRQWKLVRPDRALAWQLYDLRRDQSETTDLAGRNANLVASLAARFDAWRNAMPSGLTGPSRRLG
ncbi:MAG: sulfatase-like hydrolase/transferase [Bryobacteraceae bacterium]|nr:sulfatase-like hydrolase/transferase [Bryobacteraceae bacterium]